ncbi:ribbon-helix-helix domain-containing protein [Ferrovibrio terrae]|jgi:predicted DNA-binding ribbon-helix-helix protein|uniref:ribbon-helix-helix domain-containing protein n=1 Tax=Ferrovibrio terrae TaxID=2594003 RepID=UPI0031377E3F
MPTTRRPQHTSTAHGSSLITRNLRLGRGRTSIRLERLEWAALDAICGAEGVDRHHFAMQVDRDPARREKTLTSRVRSAILAYFVARSGIRVPLLGNGLATVGLSPAPGPAEREESRN